ncbi:hypothetical protein [Oscillibacter sp.]|uniref:thioesterase family protein n=1 Tax=Oscillibacter sp. TaxID=1945593 RepID=UPI0033903C36
MILIGTKCRLEQTVTDALTAANVGSGALPVFGTPYMSALMENAAMTCLQSFLEEGQGSVGTHLDISTTLPPHRHEGVGGGRDHRRFGKRQNGGLRCESLG